MRGRLNPKLRGCYAHAIAEGTISAGTMGSVGNIALPMILIALAWDIATSSAMLPTVPSPLRL